MQPEPNDKSSFMRSKEDVADYIMSHAIELRALAKCVDLSLLVYFLDLVVAEACAAVSASIENTID